MTNISPTPSQPHTQPSPGFDPVKMANKASDYIVLTLVYLLFFFATSIYFIVSYFTDEATQAEGPSIAGFLITLVISLLVFGGVLLGGMFLTRMMRQTMLGNSLQIEYSDYAWLREWSNKVARDLAMPEVEIFITQDPVINAYSYGFVRPYNIVLQSGTVRYLTRDELKVVIVHEMAHIKYGHTIASVYLQPFLIVPIIGAIGAYIAGFWQRRTELTADRLALMYTRDPDLVKASLAKVHIGPDAAKYLNQVAEQWLHYKADRPMNRLAQTLSDHPFLVRRLGQIDAYAPLVQPTPPAAPASETVLQ